MSIREDVPTRRHQRSITPTKLAVIAGALIAVFLLGYVPARMSARNAQESNIRLQNELRLGNLEGHLGMASYEANQNNYANAAQHSTRFFSGLRAAIDDTSDETLKRDLERILARTDEITANIAEADPAVKEKLAQAYADFFQLTAAPKN